MWGDVTRPRESCGLLVMHPEFIPTAALAAFCSFSSGYSIRVYCAGKGAALGPGVAANNERSEGAGALRRGREGLPPRQITRRPAAQVPWLRGVRATAAQIARHVLNIDGILLYLA